jgi:hypothetical protein
MNFKPPAPSINGSINNAPILYFFSYALSMKYLIYVVVLVIVLVVALVVALVRVAIS